MTANSVYTEIGGMKKNLSISNYLMSEGLPIKQLSLKYLLSN